MSSFFAPAYFAPSYFSSSYFGGEAGAGSSEPGHYFAPDYFFGDYFTPPYFGGESDVCLDEIEYDPFGRKGIGVIQPISGTDYPLITPSEDVRYLFADFYLVYTDPATYAPDAEPFSPPFQIAYLEGFGCRTFGTGSADASGSSGSSESTVNTDYRIVVMDAAARIVFDSATEPNVVFDTREWGPRLRILQWVSPLCECRAVIHTKWSPDGNPPPKVYSDAFSPVSAVLDVRTVAKVPKQLRSIVAAGIEITDVSSLILAYGYNTTLTALPTRARGRRRTTAIEFRAVAGSGLGVYPDCTTPPGYIYTIAGQAPDARGNFVFAAAECYYARQPTTLDGAAGYPTVSRSPYNEPETGLPDDLAGTSKFVAGWPPADNPNYAQLQLGNDCQPCCDCVDYISFAEDLQATRESYRQSADIINAAAAKYREAAAAWEAAEACILANPIQVALRAQFSPFLDFAVQFANNAPHCHSDLRLSIVFDTLPDGGTAVLVPGYTVITGPDDHADRYTLSGTWPTFTATWPSVAIGQAVSVRGRLQFSSPTVYTVTATAHGVSSYGPLTVPGGAVATATASETLRKPLSSAETFAPTPYTTD